MNLVIENNNPNVEMCFGEHRVIIFMSLIDISSPVTGINLDVYLKSIQYDFWLLCISNQSVKLYKFEKNHYYRGGEGLATYIALSNLYLDFIFPLLKISCYDILLL